MMKQLKGKFTHKPTELEDLLKTGVVAEQVKRIQALMRPTFTLAITLDARTGQISLTNVGSEIPLQVAHQMLDGARMALSNMQVKQTVQAPSPAETTPIKPDKKEA